MKNTARTFCCILMTVVTLVLTVCPAFAVENTMEGHFGDDLIWLFTPGNSTMYIKGEGELDALQNDESLRKGRIADRIRTVVIGEGVTKIGACAFRGCTALTEVRLPESLQSIGREAFACSGLTQIRIPQNVVLIGSSAFAHCRALTAVTIDARHPMDICSDCFLDTPFLGAAADESDQASGSDQNAAPAHDAAEFLKTASMHEHLPHTVQEESVPEGTLKLSKKIPEKTRKKHLTSEE